MNGLNEGIEGITRENNNFVAALTTLFNTYTQSMSQNLDRMQDISNKVNDQEILWINMVDFFKNLFPKTIGSFKIETNSETGSIKIEFRKYIDKIVHNDPNFKQLLSEDIKNLHHHQIIDIEELPNELNELHSLIIQVDDNLNKSKKSNEEFQIKSKQNFTDINKKLQRLNDINKLKNKIKEIQETDSTQDDSLRCIKYELKKLISAFQIFVQDLDNYKSDQDLQYKNLKDSYDTKFQEQEEKIENLNKLILSLKGEHKDFLESNKAQNAKIEGSINEVNEKINRIDSIHEQYKKENDKRLNEQQESITTNKNSIDLINKQNIETLKVIDNQENQI